MAAERTIAILNWRMCRAMDQQNPKSNSLRRATDQYRLKLWRRARIVHENENLKTQLQMLQKNQPQL